MSKYYRENGKFYEPDFGPGRTKQAYKDSCDVNKIIKKAAVAGGLSHVQKYPEAIYGEFDGEMDLLTAHERIATAKQIFAELPAEVRREFNNNAIEFVKYAGALEPGELVEKIPEIAKPGDYFPNPVQRGGTGAGAATAPSETPSGAPQGAISPDPSPTPTDQAPSD